MRLALESAVRFVARDRAMLSAASDVGLMTMDLATRFCEPVAVVLERGQRDGVFRADLVPEDIPRLVSMLFGTLPSIDLDGDGDGWRRYLDLMLDMLGSTETELAAPTPVHETSPARPRRRRRSPTPAESATVSATALHRLDAGLESSTSVADDLDTAIAALSDAYTDVTVALPSQIEQLSVRLERVRLPSLAIGTLEISRSTVRSPCYPCYAVCLPIRGQIRITQSGASAIVCGHRGAVVSPGEPVSVEYLTDDCRMETLLFERADLEAELSAALGRAVISAVRFELALDQHDTVPVHRALAIAHGELARPSGLTSTPLVSAHLGRLVARRAARQPAEQLFRRARAPRRDRGLPRDPRRRGHDRGAADADHRRLRHRPCGRAQRPCARCRLPPACRPLPDGPRPGCADGAGTEELQAQDPDVTTATRIAYTWGFGNYGRFSRRLPPSVRLHSVADPAPRSGGHLRFVTALIELRSAAGSSSRSRTVHSRPSPQIEADQLEDLDDRAVREVRTDVEQLTVADPWRAEDRVDEIEQAAIVLQQRPAVDAVPQIASRSSAPMPAACGFGMCWVYSYSQPASAATARMQLAVAQRQLERGELRLRESQELPGHLWRVREHLDRGVPRHLLEHREQLARKRCAIGVREARHPQPTLAGLGVLSGMPRSMKPSGISGAQRLNHLGSSGFHSTSSHASSSSIRIMSQSYSTTVPVLSR